MSTGVMIKGKGTRAVLADISDVVLEEVLISSNHQVGKAGKNFRFVQFCIDWMLPFSLTVWMGWGSGGGEIRRINMVRQGRCGSAVNSP